MFSSAFPPFGVLVIITRGGLASFGPGASHSNNRMDVRRLQHCTLGGIDMVTAFKGDLSAVVCDMAGFM